MLQRDPWIDIKCKRCGEQWRMPLRNADKVRDFPMVGDAIGGLRKVGVTCQKCGREISATLPRNPAVSWGSPPAMLGPQGRMRTDVAAVLRENTWRTLRRFRK